MFELIVPIVFIIASIVILNKIANDISNGDKRLKRIIVVTFIFIVSMTIITINVIDAKEDMTWDDYRSMIEVTQRNTGVIGIIVDDAPMINNSTTIKNIEQLLKNKHFKPTIKDNIFDCSETSRATALYLREMGYDNTKITLSMNLNKSSPNYGEGHTWVVITDEQTGGMLSIETRLKTQAIGEIVSKDTKYEYYRGFIIEVEDYNKIFPHEPRAANPHSVIEGW